MRAALGATLLAASAPACAASAFEDGVVAALNGARAHPAAFATALQRYRGFFRSNLVSLPGAAVAIETSEGVAAVDEAIRFLAGQRTLGAVARDPDLARAAARHAADEGAAGTIGHRGSDGLSPEDRATIAGAGSYMAEVIEYGAASPEDAVRQLIVDDGLARRAHRAILFDPRLRLAGVACGPHPLFRTMCVIDFGQ